MNGKDVLNSLLGKKKKATTPHGALVKTVAKPVVVDPYVGFTLDPSIEAFVTLSSEVFMNLIVWYNTWSDREITGFGVIADDGEVVWVCHTDTGTAAHVDNSGDGSVAAVFAAMDAGYDGINLHWHTHPGFGPFYSNEDKRHHASRAKSAPIGGDMTYMVVDGIYILVRRVVVDAPGVYRYNDGVVYLMGAEQPFPDDKPKQKHVITKVTATPWSKTTADAKGIREDYCGDLGSEWGGSFYNSSAITSLKCCPQCSFEFGYSVGTVGHRCDICDVIIRSGAYIGNEDEVGMMPDAEEVLDEYLDIVCSGDAEKALGYLKTLAKTQYFTKVFEEFKRVDPAPSNSPTWALARSQFNQLRIAGVQQ